MVFTGISFDAQSCFLTRDAAIPAASPIHEVIGMMRKEEWASWVEEMGLPATMRLSAPVGMRAR